MASFNIDGQDALNQIRLLIAEVNNLKRAIKNISTSNVDDFNKLENNFNNLKSKVGLLANRLNYLEAILRKNSDALNRNTSSINSNTNSTNQNSNSKDKQSNNIDKTTKSTDRNTASTNKNRSSILSLNKAVGFLLRTFGIVAGVQIFKNILKEVFETTKTFDSLNFALEKITGSTLAAADSQRFLLDITDKYGTELVTTTNRWIKFLAAAKQSGLSLKDTEGIFRSVTKASSVLGLKTDELTGVYLALEQMLSKGKVTTEELRRQLGERLPGAMGIMAAALGVTIPKLDEMLKKGEVLSADALPKFAEALEIAYDIKHVETIDTLIAAQNRLTRAWQLFIKNITEGDSVIRKFFAGFIELATGAIETLNNLLASDSQKLEIAISASTTVLEAELDEKAEAELLMEGFKLRKQINEAKIKLEEATSKEMLDIAQEEYNNAIKALQKHNEEKETIIKNIAKEGIDQAKTDYDIALEEYEAFLQKSNDLEELFRSGKNSVFGFNNKFSEANLKDIFGGEVFGDKLIENKKDFEEVFSIVEDKLADATAKWRLYKKVLEESNVVVPDDDTTEKTQRNLRIIKDLTLEIQNAILKGNVDMNKRILKDDRSSIDQKLKAQKSLFDSEKTILKNNAAIKIRDIENSNEKELESLKKSLKNGRLSREKYDKFVLDSEEEKRQKIELIYIELANKLNELNNSNLKISIDIALDSDEISIDKIEDNFNRRIIALKEEYNAFSTSAKRKKEIEKELRDVSVEMANAIIEKKIEILEASIAGANADEEWVKQIKRDIADLKAKLKINPPEDENKWFEYFKSITDYASEFFDAVGSIVDGVFANRIENINAEIEAERDKYDALIALAEDDEKQQQNLREEKEARIKELEKKRLREEQKQAKARKAFAIADIAISTSQAILSIWAQVPKFDFGISAGLMTAFVAALGAAQIAAVLAQPIPKYKEGGKITKEHIGMINDGLYKEYVERKGEILTTNTKNAIVNLLPGDVVYKNYDDMAKKSSLINAMTNSNKINQDKYDNLLFGIEKSIEKGFKRVRINNSIINKIPNNNSYYEDKMSRW